MNGGTTPVGVHYHACYERHDPGATHPESPARYRALRAALEELPPEIVRLPGRAATVPEILLAHEHWYHDLVYRDVEAFADQLRTGDTAICPESYDVAREAAGGVLAAAEAVMRGEVSRVFCAVRPGQGESQPAALPRLVPSTRAASRRSSADQPASATA